ncbi:MAG: DUF4147 domain-containing protein [Patescibacteria group bacterium]|nr:DUF4147 domain-containing protein [Patescibacteria group bacterium]
MKIKNFNNLALTSTRKNLLEIIEAGLQAIDTKNVLEQNVRIEGDQLFIQNHIFKIARETKILVVGIGKCSFDAGLALENILVDRIKGGIVLDVRGGNLKKIRSFIGTHPYPSDKNVEATEEIIKLLSNLKKDDLVIFIISGGGSTLLCAPTNFEPEEETALVKYLFKAGADIEKINTIRKHISLVRGGNLAKAAYPARIVSVIFSDVPGDNLEFIASGPTVKDTTTLVQAEDLLKRYNVKEGCGFDGQLIETPKESKYFENAKNILLVTNKIALEAMAGKAKNLGLRTKIVTNQIMGEAKDVGRKIISDLEVAGEGAALFYGGETTVTAKGTGKGGRNQELVLSVLRFVGDNQIMASIASDGHDNTEFSGAICDKITRERMLKLNLDPEKYLEENNSFEFFSRVGDYILTGDTGSNVSDLIIAINEPR